ncbi:phosphatase PAP2 family protein [Catellatospora methionotrophica]|uniref:Phosphatase PAP2 family protein n=1 Tax=Catellatospora methionotrophica TaxID=121620 RepID=A0A8J3LHQ9_9ACTN|nr:phosphatase PAP2 family protein [Catellatospora methionotrophica]GIG18470.1 phosphatase PAP2 family protein [Catellatospora methionotrophica]
MLVHTDARRRWLWTAAAAVAAYALLTFAVEITWPPLVEQDAVVSAAAHRLALEYPAWRVVMSAVTRTGDTVVLLSVLAFTLGFLLRRRMLAHLAFVCAAVAASAALRLVVHALVARDRPEGMLALAAGWSYPSGHTSHFATAALLLFVLVWPLLGARWQRVALVATVGGWAVLVGASRVALVVHWPSDVLGGWLVALAAVPLAFMTHAVRINHSRP